MEISKNELAGALSALGKLVCRTSPVEAYRSLRIEGKENKISFQTVSVDEAVTYTLPAEDAGDFAVNVCLALLGFASGVKFFRRTLPITF